MSTITFSYRQKEIMRYLFNQDTITSYQEIADQFDVSKRTIQREMNNLRPLLAPYHVKVMKKIGAGIYLKGKEDDIDQLKNFLEQTKPPSSFSPEERREWITYDLILSEEPVKQYTLSKDYNVTEATIGNDLEEVAKLLKHHDIQLIRRPGLGVYIKATEYQRRNFLSQLIHKDISFEEWMQLFNQEDKENGIKTGLDDMIRARLLKLASPNQINKVEHIVRKVIQKENHLEMSDKNYVNLIVHLLLAVERIREDRFITNHDFPENLCVDEELIEISRLIVDGIEEGLDIVIPDIEVDYIALHLAGARMSKSEIALTDREEFTWVEFTEMFINEAEKHLQISLQGDEELREGLIAHFAPAINRLKHGLQIHNPLLERTKKEYEHVFHACRKACEILEKEMDLSIPESEIGYLTMHIGASLIRIEEPHNKQYSVLVVCASGFGTSTYLASTLQQKMPNIVVEEIVSLQQLQSMKHIQRNVDLIISTVSLPMIDQHQVVNVSPFLTENDIKNVEAALRKIATHQVRPSEGRKETRSVAQYGEAMLQILEGLRITHMKAKEPMELSLVLEELEEHPLLINRGVVLNDLAQREKLGGFVLDGVAMIHTKSKGVNGLLVSVLFLDHPVAWVNDAEQEQLITTILFLATPKETPPQHTKMISEISAALADDHFLNILQSHDASRLEGAIEEVLTDAYERKIREMLKGNY